MAYTVADSIVPVKVARQPVADDPSAGTSPSASIGPENVKFAVVGLIEPPPPIALGVVAVHWTDTVLPVIEDSVAV